MIYAIKKNIASTSWAKKNETIILAPTWYINPLLPTVFRDRLCYTWSSILMSPTKPTKITMYKIY